CHAELKAIVNKNSSDVKDCTMYVTLFPCNECAKIIIQFRLKTIVYLWEQARKPKTSAAMKMFDAADLTYRSYNSRKIEINFCDITEKTEKKEEEGESSFSQNTEEQEE
ncbi:hypothetical protein HN011_001854, partial [Eciton burchellii]